MTSFNTHILKYQRQMRKEIHLYPVWQQRYLDQVKEGFLLSEILFEIHQRPEDDYLLH